MRIVGLIGGLGPESTVDYYKQIIALYRERTGGSYPAIIINSVDLSKGLKLATELRHAELADYLAEEVERLARASASFGAITANTAHVVFDEVSRRSRIPLISIVEAACAEAKRRKLRRLGLLGTRMTMQAKFYPEVFGRAGLDVVTPAAADQEFVHEKYIGELLVGTFLPETKKSLLAAIDRLREEQGIDGALLAGTELPLILKEEAHNGVALLDTTKIHVAAIVERMI